MDAGRAWLEWIVRKYIMKTTIPKQIKPKQIAVQASNAYRASLPLRAAELTKAVEIAADLLAVVARTYGYGEEYQKINDWMIRVQGIYDESTRVLETGSLWRDGEVII